MLTKHIAYTLHLIRAQTCPPNLQKFVAGFYLTIENLPGDLSGTEPLLSIPNRIVKRTSADDSVVGNPTRK